jgi:hypothetical protein
MAVNLAKYSGFGKTKGLFSAGESEQQGEKERG